jgi:hypothetical protein
MSTRDVLSTTTVSLTNLCEERPPFTPSKTKVAKFGEAHELCIHVVRAHLVHTVNNQKSWNTHWYWLVVSAPERSDTFLVMPSLALSMPCTAASPSATSPVHSAFITAITLATLPTRS